MLNELDKEAIKAFIYDFSRWTWVYRKWTIKLLAKSTIATEIANLF